MPRRSRWRVAMAVATASLIAAVPLVAAEPAFAQYPPAPGVVIDDATVAPGDPINFTATGFQPAEPVVASLVPGAAAGAAAAAARSLRTSPSSVQPIAAATPKGDDCDDGGDGDTVVLGTFTADANGIVTGTVTIPESVPPGIYLFQLVGSTSGVTVSAQVTVTGDASPPPGDCDGSPPPGDGDGNGRPGDDDGNGRPGDGDGDDDHGRPGDGGGDGDHGRPGDGDDDHGRPGSGDDDHGRGDDRGNGSSGHGDRSPGLADTGSSDAPVALLTAAGGLVLLGGASLVIARRRRSDTDRG
ncbi:LPXTG cell wall anchor domain-containing protein [Streptomyces sp. NPDC002870]|uniref:LPXTG cell wall anchor domain-containing protein n=1 Tax=Streptomyces sp. NPDC002870 TaxID=3364666 RepID=UPI003689D00B